MPLPRTRTGRRALVAALTAGLLLPLTACGGDGAPQDGAAKSTGASGVPAARLTVLAAASLTDVFETAGAAYEKSHPGTEITFSFAGSQELVAQIAQGSPADVLVTADAKSMDKVRADTGAPSSSPGTGSSSPPARATRTRSTAWRTSRTPDSRSSSRPPRCRPASTAGRSSTPRASR